MKNDAVMEELEAVRAANGGLLRPEDVVKFAEDKDTALHSRFEWDNGKAAHQYRVWQARVIINVCVKHSPSEGVPSMPVYVSLKDDRKLPGGGYRVMVEVLTDAERREQLLEQALAEAESWQEKYRNLSELSDIFAALEKAKKKKRRKKAVAGV